MIRKYTLISMALVVLAVQAVTFETLNLSTLINTDSIFQYANILLVALGPVVLIGLGFALAKFIIGFVQRAFSSL